MQAGKKSSNYFPGWKKHNSLISWRKGEQKQFLAGSKVLWRRSWLASAFYNIWLAGTAQGADKIFRRELIIDQRILSNCQAIVRANNKSILKIFSLSTPVKAVHFGRLYLRLRAL